MYASYQIFSKGVCLSITANIYCTFCDVLPGWQTGGYGVMLLPRWQFSAPFQILQPLERALSCRRQTRWRLDATAKDNNIRVPLGGAQGARRRGRGSHPRRSCRRNVR